MPRFERKHLQTPLKTKIKATQQLCFHPCLSANTFTLKTADQIMKFQKWLDIIRGLIDYILSNPYLRSGVLEVKRSKSFLQITPFKIVIQSSDKIKICRMRSL